MENQFETLDRLEAEEEKDIRAWVREIMAIHMRRPARERAYKIVKLYFSSEETNRETHLAFMDWLTNGHDKEAKQWALDKYIDELEPSPATKRGYFPEMYCDEEESAVVATLAAVN